MNLKSKVLVRAESGGWKRGEDPRHDAACEETCLTELRHEMSSVDLQNLPLNHSSNSIHSFHIPDALLIKTQSENCTYQNYNLCVTDGRSDGRTVRPTVGQTICMGAWEDI